MIEVRKSSERGRTRLSWLDSRHSFSFGGYFDPRHQGVSVLRVINDDQVCPGAGFPPHGHRDMEIISYVTEGAIEHKDTVGAVQRVSAGDFQLMSAGSGIAHSEYNPSREKPLKFLQIWIHPDRRGLAPAYQQRSFPRIEGFQAIATPDGEDESLRLHQDARLLRLKAGAGAEHEWNMAADRVVYVHVVQGAFEIADVLLEQGDGVTMRSEAAIRFVGRDDANEALIFDLP